MNILTWTILKKTQILNGCETFAFKYRSRLFLRSFEFKVSSLGKAVTLLRVYPKIGVGVYRTP